MSTQTQETAVLELNDIGELFNAPDANPFSTHEVEILGQAGMDRLQKRVTSHWPRRAHLRHVTLRLPPDQITPGLVVQTHAAIQRYCAAQVARNQMERRNALRMSLRQFAIAGVVLAIDFAIIYWLMTATAEFLPGFLRGVLVVLALLAGSIALWDAIESALFSWLPFVRDATSYRHLSTLDVDVEPSDAYRENKP